MPAEQVNHLPVQTATLEQAHLADDVPSDRMAHACLQAGHTTGLHSLEQLHHDCLLSDSVAWPAHPQETVPEKANTSTNGARPSLALQNNYITSLHGLEQLHSLQKLYLEGNSLARIEHLGALRRLRELHVSRQLLPEGQGVEFDGSCLQVSELSVVHPAQQGSPRDSEAQLLQLTSIRRPAHTQKAAACLVLVCRWRALWPTVGMQACLRPVNCALAGPVSKPEGALRSAVRPAGSGRSGCADLAAGPGPQQQRHQRRCSGAQGSDGVPASQITQPAGQPHLQADNIQVGSRLPGSQGGGLGSQANQPQPVSRSLPHKAPGGWEALCRLAGRQGPCLGSGGVCAQH